MRIELKNARQQKGLDVSDIAKILNISASFYYKIESGIRNPNIQLAKKMSDFFQRDIEDLFFDNELDVSSKV